jgi:hypothetical protein
MAIGRLELLALYLEITNEATVVAQAMGDALLTSLAGAAALAAGRRMCLSDEQVLAMQRDMFDMRMEGPPGLRIAPDLEGPSTATAIATRPQTSADDPADDDRACDRALSTRRRQ